MKLVLYSYWRSSSSYRVRLALAHKGLLYETVPVNLLEGAQESEVHRARSPMGFVPCLSVDGEMIVESVAICELLEELAPTPPLLPSDPKHRAHVRALVEIVNAGTQPLQNLSVQKRIKQGGMDAGGWTREVIERGLSAFERLMQYQASIGIDGPFACGGSFTLADVFLLPQVYNASRNQVSLSPFDRVARAVKSGEETYAYRVARPEAQPDAPKP